MQRHAFIRNLGLKFFSVRARDSENTCPSHSPYFQFYVTRVVNERELKGMGRAAVCVDSSPGELVQR